MLGSTMRSAWMAGILSPILVGIVLYSIGSLFGVDRTVVHYFSENAAQSPVIVIEPLARERPQKEKTYSGRLVHDRVTDPPQK